MEDSPHISLLRGVVRWLGAQHGPSIPSWFHRLGMMEMEVLGLHRKELRVSRELWRAHFDLLSQMDELRAATERMRLTAMPEEQVSGGGGEGSGGRRGVCQVSEVQAGVRCKHVVL